MRFRIFFVFSFPIFLLLTLSFTSRKKYKSIQDIAPPGVVQIDEQLYMDQREVANFNWLEYEYWVKLVYGRNSAEYAATLPDTALWNAETTKNHLSYFQNYLRHPAYRDYPVVGLSYRQMCDYCKWRSDRVLEYMLITLGKIAFDTNPTPATFFTTEKYLQNNYLNYTKDPSIQVIPQYYLPTPEEWNRADLYNQKIYDQLSERRLRKRSPGVYYAQQNAIDPVQPVAPSTKYCVKGAIYNLHRNVSEQLADSMAVTGANWKQFSFPGEEENTVFQPAPAVTKGFRCAFQWKPVF